mgnify:CR=1 FL=1
MLFCDRGLPINNSQQHLLSCRFREPVFQNVGSYRCRQGYAVLFRSIQSPSTVEVIEERRPQIGCRFSRCETHTCTQALEYCQSQSDRIRCRKNLDFWTCILQAREVILLQRCILVQSLRTACLWPLEIRSCLLWGTETTVVFPRKLNINFGATKASRTQSDWQPELNEFIRSRTYALPSSCVGTHFLYNHRPKNANNEVNNQYLTKTNSDLNCLEWMNKRHQP